LKPAGNKHAPTFFGKILGDPTGDDGDFAGELLAGHRDFHSQWVALAQLLCGLTRDIREEVSKALSHRRWEMIAERHLWISSAIV